jgi:fatty acid desaturase
LWRKVTLHDVRQRSSGKIARRSRGERALIVVLALASLTLIWYFAPSVALAVALSVLLLLFLPVLVILMFDKRSA